MSDLDSLRAQATDMMQVRTANYRPPMYYRPSFNMLGLPPFTLMTVEWMKRDPQIKLGMSLKTAPFHKVRMTMKGDPEVVEFMGTQIKKFWQKAMPKIMRAFWYTMSAGEIIYKLNEQTHRYDFDNMIEFYPRDVHILHHNGIPKGIKVIPNAANGSVPVGMATDTNNTDAFSGMHEPVQLLFPKGFLYVHNAEFNSLIGQSDFEGAYDPWLEKTDYQGAKQSRKLWFFKNAFSGGMMFHPPGSYQLPSGEKIPYADIARQAMETSLNGAVWCIEQKFDPETKQPMWQYVSPQFNPGGEHLLEYVQALDTEILRGLGIPDDVISQVSGAGSFAGRTIPLMAFFISQESVLDNLFTVCDEQVFRPLCRANFGHDHYEATVDVDIESLMGMMAGADGNSGTQDGMDASLEAAQMKSEGVDVTAPGPEQMSETGEVYTHTIRQFSLSTGSDLVGKLMREIGKRIGVRRTRPSNPTIDINFNTEEVDDDEPLQFGNFDESKHPRGKKGSDNGGQFVGKGSTGNVTKVGNKAYKNASKKESDAYKELKGTPGVSPGFEENGKIVTPFYKNILSVDTIPPERRKSFAALVVKNLPRMVETITAVSQKGFDYNDPLQFGFNESKESELFDFSMADQVGEETARTENLNRLSAFLHEFGAGKHADAINQVSSVWAYVDDADTREFDSESPEAKDAEKVVKRLGEHPAKFAYYTFNAREIPSVAQTEPRNSVKTIFTEGPLKPEFMQQWEIHPAYHTNINAPVQMSDFDESKHPRGRKGTKQGGQFVSKHNFEAAKSKLLSHEMGKHLFENAVRDAKSASGMNDVQRQSLKKMHNLTLKFLDDEHRAAFDRVLSEFEGMFLHSKLEDVEPELADEVGSPDEDDKDQIPGGLGDNADPDDFDQEELAKGIKVESEHTDDPDKAREIAMDHLTEDPDYYKKLAEIESPKQMSLFDDPTIQLSDFDENKHPRAKAGTTQGKSHGGQFVSKEDAAKTKSEIKKLKSMISSAKNIPDKKMREKTIAMHQKKLDQLLSQTGEPEKPAKPKPVKKPIEKPPEKEPEPEPEEEEPEETPEPESEPEPEKEPEPETPKSFSDLFYAAFRDGSDRGRTTLDARNHAIAQYLTNLGVKDITKDTIQERYRNHHIDALGSNATDEQLKAALIASTNTAALSSSGYLTYSALLPRPGSTVAGLEKQQHDQERQNQSLLETAAFWDKDAEIMMAIGEKDKAILIKTNADRTRQSIYNSERAFKAAKKEAQAREDTEQAERQERAKLRPESETKHLTPVQIARELESHTRFAMVKMLATTGWLTDSKLLAKPPEAIKAKILGSLKRPDYFDGVVPPFERLLESTKQSMQPEPAEITGYRWDESQSDQYERAVLRTKEGKEALVNSKYVHTIRKMYPKATFHLTTKGGPVAIQNDGELVGVLAPFSE